MKQYTLQFPQLTMKLSFATHTITHTQCLTQDSQAKELEEMYSKSI